MSAIGTVSTTQSGIRRRGMNPTTRGGGGFWLVIMSW